MSNASELHGHLDPRRVSVSRSRGLVIEWGDGHRSEYALRYLRDRCPCATCTEIHGPAAGQPSPFPIYQPALQLLGAEPVGRYAVRLLWSDGHNTGIYTWEHLRSICPCPECTPPARG